MEVANGHSGGHEVEGQDRAMSRNAASAGWPWWARAISWALAAIFTAVPVVHLVGSTMQGPGWETGFESAFTGWSYHAVPWLLGLATFAAGLGADRPLHRATGLGLMTVPVWETLWGILDSIVELQQGGFVFRAFTEHELSSLYLYKFVEDIGYLALGFLIYASDAKPATRRWSALFLGALLLLGTITAVSLLVLRSYERVLPAVAFLAVLAALPLVAHQTPRTLARRLSEVGLSMGRRAEGPSALLGLVLFPVLLVSTVAVNVFLNGFDQLSQSDESSIFDNMTVFHAVMVSLAAAFTEELVYRGVVMVGLSRRMPMLSAIVLQAVFFGFAHSGYGTWIHIILPTLFGLVAGLVAWRFGIWAAIVLHVMVDLFAFGADASSNVPWLWQAIVWGFLANCVLTLTFAALWVVRRIEGQRVPPPA